MSTQEWMETLKPGDRVVVESHWRGPSVATVKRFTATQVVVTYLGRESKFNKSTSRLVGDGSSYHPTKLIPLTPERDAQIRRLRMIEIAKNADWGKVNDSDLGRIVKILQESKP